MKNLGAKDIVQRKDLKCEECEEEGRDVPYEIFEDDFEGFFMLTLEQEFMRTLWFGVPDPLPHITPWSPWDDIHAKINGWLKDD